MTSTDGGVSPWESARSLDDLAQATTAFLRGALKETPVHGGPPNDETGPLIPALIEMNGAGFVTTDSQPGVSDPDGAQRAYVEGMCSQATAERVVPGLLDTELVVLSFAPRASAWGSIAVTVDAGEPFTFLGRQDPDYFGEYFANGSDELDEALARSWKLQVFDPVWGRNDVLWSQLVAVLAPR